MDIRKYIIDRMSYYNRNNYQYGFVTAEEIIFGLGELAALAKAAELYDLYDLLSKKSSKLRDLRLKGPTYYPEFVNSI